jgi:hypothetical protein
MSNNDFTTNFNKKKQLKVTFNRNIHSYEKFFYTDIKSYSI